MKYDLVTDSIVKGAYRYVDFVAAHQREPMDPDDIDDLRSVAGEALLHAAETYRDDRGSKFSTWARLLVKKAVKRQLAIQGDTSNKGGKLARRWMAAVRARDAFVKRELRTPSNREWAEEAEEDYDSMLYLIERCSHKTILYDYYETDRVDVEDSTDWLEQAEIFHDADLATAALIEAKDALGADKVRVFVYVTFNEDGLSQSDIGSMFAIDQTTVSRWTKEVAKFVAARLKLGQEGVA